MFLFVISCMNESIKPKIDPSSEINQESLSKTTQTFLPLASLAWEVHSNPDYKILLYSEIAKKFDGDANALLNIFTNNESFARYSGYEFSNKVSTTLVDFNIASGEKFAHPQIYIPFYDELKANGMLGVKDPVIVLRDGPPSNDGLYQGYTYKNDRLCDRGMISEEFATENEVWVISINERVDQSGNLRNARQETYTQSIIDRLTIKGSSCLKEDWVGGNLEVNVIRWFDNISQTSTGARFYSDGAADGDRVANVSRKSAKKSTTQWNLNFDFITGWNTDATYTNLEYAYYVIFEYDPWPAGTSDAVFSSSFSYEYRSYEGYYDKNIIHRNSADNYDVNVGCISWVMD